MKSTIWDGTSVERQHPLRRGYGCRICVIRVSGHTAEPMARTRSLCDGVGERVIQGLVSGRQCAEQADTGESGEAYK